MPQILRPDATSYAAARWLFLRALGLAYFFAFSSLGVQVLGLVGSHGIQPAQEFLGRAAAGLGPSRFWRLPTVFWINAGDAWLQGVCAAGAAVSLLIIADVLPGPLLLAAWGLYLSLVSVGNDFLAFQWDNLLLEAGLL